MPIDLRAVLTSRSLGVFVAGRTDGLSWLDWNGDTAVAQIVRAQEAWGFDSTVVSPPLTSSDPAVLSSFALAASSKIDVVAAHRIGIQQPTQAARAFATRAVLSRGRAKILLLTDGALGRDRADGDALTGAERARRALEYAEIFWRELSSAELFDVDGEFYTVRGAFSGIKPPTLDGVIAATGLQAHEIEIAARFADTYALPATTLERTGQIIDRVRGEAQLHGREIAFWRAGNVILAETDEAAQQHAEAVTAQVRAAAAPPAEVGRAGVEVPGEADSELGGEAWPDAVLYQGLTHIDGRAAAIVGSVDTVAERIVAHYEQGVTTVTLGGLDGSSEERRHSLDALIAQIRRRVAEYDLSAVAA